MILVSVENVKKHFGPDPVLDGVELEIRPGDKVGLIGPNGAGKTTLLSILAGQLEPDAGTVARHPTATLALLAQRPDFEAGATVWGEARSALGAQIELTEQAEQVARAIATASDPAEHDRLAARYDRLQHEVAHHDAYNLDHKIERVLNGLGFTGEGLHQPVEQLSGGQQNRLLLAKLLLTAPEVMLLDEPSNHLDVEATEWLESFLAESRRAMVIVSHDRYFLDKVTNRTFELFAGTVDAFAGNFSAYWRQKAERIKVERRTYDRQQEAIAKAEDFIRRNQYGQKHAQAEDRRKKLVRIERAAPPREIAAPVMGFPPPTRSGDIVLRVEHLAKAFDAPLFSDLSIDILRGERWGILGPNGSGKTTLLRIVVGQERADEGAVTLGTGVAIGYYDQLHAGVDPQAEAIDAVRPRHKEFNQQQRRGLLARFGIVGDMVFQSMGSLSGGERSRATLAKLAAEDANFLILDEPTNHLDLWARDALERSFAKFEGTLLLVSHDRYFLNRVADHLLVIEPTGVRVVAGNYDTYLHLTRQSRHDDTGNANGEAPSDAKRPQAKARKPKPERPRRRFPYRKVADIEQEIFGRERRLEELHHELLKPDILRDGDRVRAIRAELAENEAALASLYEHWEEASELN